MARTRLAEKILAGEINPDEVNLYELLKEIITHSYTAEDLKEIGGATLGGAKGAVFWSAGTMASGAVSNDVNSFANYYTNLLKNPYDKNAQTKVQNMSEIERVFARAGANAESLETATMRAKGMEYDGNKEIEAYEYGLEQRKRGNGQDLDLLIEATDYLDNAGESGIIYWMLMIFT